MISAVILDTVCKRSDQRLILDGVSFSVEKGSVTAIVGPGGSGKTTLFSAITGFILPDSGSVTVFDESERDHWAGKTGFLAQGEIFQSELQFREEFAFLLSLSGYEAPEIGEEIGKALAAAGIDPDLRADLPLSWTVRRKLAIARTFLGNPPLILLDEPENGLDQEGKKALADTLERLKGTATILISSTGQVFCESLCDYFIVMEGGKIVRKTVLQEIQGDEYSIIYLLDSDFRADFTLEIPMIPGVAKVDKIESTKIRVTLKEELSDSEVDRASKMIIDYLHERNYAIRSIMRDSVSRTKTFVDAVDPA